MLTNSLFKTMFKTTTMESHNYTGLTHRKEFKKYKPLWSKQIFVTNYLSYSCP